MKKVYRSRHTKVLGGVAAGLAEYFDIDVTVMRLIFALLLVTIPNTIIAYILAWIIIPEEPPGLSARAPEKSSTGGAAMIEKEGNTFKGGMTADDIIRSQGAGSSCVPHVPTGSQGGTQGTAAAPDAGQTPEAPMHPAAASSPSSVQTSATPTGQKPVHGSGDKSRQLLGYILIAVGALVMVNRYLPISIWNLSRQLVRAWPVAIIVVGIAIIVGAVRGR